MQRRIKSEREPTCKHFHGQRTVGGAGAAPKRRFRQTRVLIFRQVTRVRQAVTEDKDTVE